MKLKKYTFNLPVQTNTYKEIPLVQGKIQTIVNSTNNINYFTATNLVLVSIILVYFSLVVWMINYSYFFENPSEHIFNYEFNKEIINNMRNEILYFQKQSFLFNEQINSVLKILDSNSVKTIILELNQFILNNSEFFQNSILEDAKYRVIGVRDYKDLLYHDSTNYWNEIFNLDPYNVLDRRTNSYILQSLALENSGLNNFRSFLFQEIINNNLRIITEQNHLEEIIQQTNFISRENMFKLSLPILMCFISLLIINTSLHSNLPLNYFI
jgi:hypothetical protein